MDYGDGVHGANVVMFGKKAYPDSDDFVAVNDNLSISDQLSQPAKTITLRNKFDESGNVIKVKVPVSEYFGVAVATKIDEDGILTSSIELVHEDADFNYQVYEESGNAQIIAEWQNWGRQLRLPLFIRSGDGELVAYSQQVDGVLLGNSSQRRKTVSEAGRRPRFLNLRK
ncbi:hypothetical protein MNBD_ALPHA11-1707 [hydrothermal vent metagenome]|uniref:Uncharacterized protein n=1 Tax=hydrothermal vent metagenome TaxID=652676 RepID=A0A3B0U6C1_9ZZZZ